MAKEYTYKNLEEFKIMIDDMFKENHQVIAIANKSDVCANFKNMPSPSRYIKQVFGENSILVEIPSTMNWDNFSIPKNVFLESFMLIWVNKEGTDFYWLLDIRNINK